MPDQDPILAQAEMGPPAEKGPVVEIQSPELPDICVGCGMHHGSQGAELRCLRRELEACRKEGKK